jgi:hypothetical protein
MLEEGESWSQISSAQINLKRASRRCCLFGLLADEYENITLTFMERTCSTSGKPGRNKGFTESLLQEAHRGVGCQASNPKPSAPDRHSPRPPQELSFSGILMREGGRTMADVDTLTRDKKGLRVGERIQIHPLVVLYTHFHPSPSIQNNLLKSRYFPGNRNKSPHNISHTLCPSPSSHLLSIPNKFSALLEDIDPWSSVL